MARVAREVFAQRAQALRGELLTLADRPAHRLGAQPLPAETELARRSGLSRKSVRQVVDRLVAEGALRREPHRGVFAANAAAGANGVSAASRDEARDAKGTSGRAALRGSVKLRLALYTTATFRARLHKLSRLFRLFAPQVEIDFIELQAHGYAQTLLSLFRSGMAPDLVLLMNYQLSSLGALAPELFAALDETRVAEAPEAVRRPWTVEGATLAAPLSSSPVVFACNTDLFARAGVALPAADWTWEDLRTTATQLTERLRGGGRGTDTGPTAGANGAWGTVVTSRMNRWPAYVFQAGGALATPDGRRALVDTPAFAEALAFTSDLIHEARCAPPLAAVDFDSVTPDPLFEWGRTAISEITAWSFERWGTLPFRFTLLPPPRGRRAAGLLLANAIAVNRNTPHLDVCCALVDFLLSPPVQEFLQLDGYGLPAFSGTDAIAPSTAEHVALLQAVMPLARVLERAEVLVMEAIGERLTMALGGAIGRRDAIDQMQRVANEQLTGA